MTILSIKFLSFTGYFFHDMSNAFRLIEEFMLLANSLTAEKILECFPDTALLRSHNSPKEKSLSSAVEYLEKVGIFIDITDAGSIYQSMMQYEGLDEIGMARMAVITNFLVKPMVVSCFFNFGSSRFNNLFQNVYC